MIAAAAVRRTADGGKCGHTGLGPPVGPYARLCLARAEL